MKYIRLLTVLLMAIAFIKPAFADVVPPPKKSCPAGSTGASSHDGPYCAPATCKSSKECKIGYVCQDQPLCLKTVIYRVREGGARYEYIEATGICKDRSACNELSSCKTAKRCIPNKDSKTEDGIKLQYSSCGCSQAQAGSAYPLLGIFSLLFLALFRKKSKSEQ